MNLIDRVKRLVLNPRTEWPVIATESVSTSSLLTGYLLPLAVIPAVALLIRALPDGFTHAVGVAVYQYVATVVGIFITAWVIHVLAPSFDSDRTFDRAFRLTTYAYTPALVGGIFNLWAPLSILASIASLYALYLLYTGLEPVMNTPRERVTVFFVISLVVMVLVRIVLDVMLLPSFMLSV